LAATDRTAPRTGLRGAVASHPVLLVFGVALAARAVVALVVDLHFGGSLFVDDEHYAQLARNFAAGRPGGALHVLHDPVFVRPLSHLLPLTALYWLFGGGALPALLYVATLGAVSAAATTRLALERLAAPWAVAAGLVVALLPAQVVFTSTTLKDSGIWAGISTLALVAAIAGRSSGRRLALLGLAAAALLVYLGGMRYPTMVIAGWSLAIALLFSAGAWRLRLARAGGAAALALAIPWAAFGLGPGGIDDVLHAHPPSYLRAVNAEQARARIVAPLAPGVPHRARGADEVSFSGADVTHIPAGVSAVLLEPFPWQSGGSLALNLARIESVLWYAILALAVLGVTRLRRLDLRVMAFPLLAGGLALLMYALTEGALGTAYRHRGELVYVVAILAAYGAAWLRAGRAAGPAARPRSRPRGSHAP
jgi:hypothetical protein